MANPEHLAMLKEGVEAWNRWRKKRFKGIPKLSEAELLSVNLSKADLSSADLSWAKLSGANLSTADLSEADLSGAELRAAKLGGANLRAASLVDVDFSGADLNNADLSVANLNAADFTGANLERVNLSRAIVGYTTFANVDLSETEGLETLIHWGPSFIGIDTIYKSEGKIPQIFLRGAGVPDDFIKNMKFMNFTRNGFYSLFISHSSQDKEFADRLNDDLQNSGVRCWLYSEDMPGGEKLEEQIDKAIHKHERMLLILSPASMASEWVKTEIAKARRLEVEENRKVLFPIRLCAIETIKEWKCFDSDIGKDSAREIREFHIPDFSNWKDHDAYKLAFDRLLKDLQGKPEPPSA